MIALDTNVLLRYLLQDDPTQSAEAAQLIASHAIILIPDIVLVETIWMLKGRKYQLKKSELISVIQALLVEQSVCFENNQVVWQALNDYRRANVINGKQADFSDVLIARKAEFMAKSRSMPLIGTYTFDIAAQQLSGMLPA